MAPLPESNPAPEIGAPVIGAPAFCCFEHAYEGYGECLTQEDALMHEKQNIQKVCGLIESLRENLDYL